MANIKNFISKRSRQMFKGGITIPLSVWNTILASILGVIGMVLMAMYTEYGTTQDKVIANETRIVEVEKHLNSNDSTLDEFRNTLTTIQSVQATNSGAVRRMESDISMILQLLMQKNSMAGGDLNDSKSG